MNLEQLILNDDRYTKGNFIKDEKNKIIFYIHQKSGCTAFLKMIFKNIGLLKLALSYDKYKGNTTDDYTGWPHYYRYSVYQYEHKVIPSDIINGNYKLIKLVRNPYTRIVSSYLHIMKVNTKLINEQFDRNNNLSFYEFLEIINTKKNLNCDLHLDKQICDFEKNDDILFDDVIKLENLTKDIIYLNNKYNLNLEFFKETIHMSKKHLNNFQLNGYINYKQLIENKNVSIYHNFYNDNKIKKLVDNFFQDDIKKYNYSFFKHKFISIGPNCHSSGLLQFLNEHVNNSLRTESYPFDWMHTNINMINNCLLTNFKIFLDQTYICEGEKYSNHLIYGCNNKEGIFVHHSIVNEYDYYQRCCDRLIQIKKNPIVFVYSLVYTKMLCFEDNNNIKYGHNNYQNSEYFSIDNIKNFSNSINNIYTNHKILIINYIPNSESYNYKLISQKNLFIINVSVKDKYITGKIWANIKNIITLLYEIDVV